MAGKLGACVNDIVCYERYRNLTVTTLVLSLVCSRV